jgi:conjugal transfer/type IV secretion protein DotA/TraY
VHILHEIFGDVVPALVAGTDPSVVDKSSNIIASMLFVYNSGVLVVGSIIVSYVLIVGMVNTAADGEALGKNWSSIFTPLRTVAGAALLLPSATGYSYIQHFILMVAMWGVGLANSIFSTGMASTTPDTVMGPVQAMLANNTASDQYGMRSFATAYLLVAHCRKSVSDTAIKYWFSRDKHAKIQPVLKGHTENKPVEQIQLMPGMTPSAVSNRRLIYTFELFDTNPETNLGGGKPVCGSVSIYGYQPGMFNDAKDETNLTKNTLDQLQKMVFDSKINAINYIIREIDAWAETMPARIDDKGWDKVAPDKLNTIVAQANAMTTNRIKGLLDTLGGGSGSGTLVTAVNKIYEGMLAKGWSNAGGWHQRVSQVRAWINNIFNSPGAEATMPNLRVLPKEDIRETLENTTKLVRSIVSKANDRHNMAPDSATAPESIESVLSSVEIDEDFDATTFTNSIARAIHKSINALQRTIVDVATGSGEDNGTANFGCGSTGKLGGSLNRMKCIGEYAAIFKVRVQVGYAAMEKVASMGSILISAVPWVGEGAQHAIFRVLNWLGKSIIDPLVQNIAIIAMYFGVIIPSLPYTIFIIVVVGWILEVTLAIVATPLWAVMLMTPERYFIGSQKQGVLMMLSLFARPALAIIGLFLAIIIADPIITFTAKAFFDMRGAVMGGNDSLVGIVAEFTTFSWWLIVYGTVLMPILYMIFGLSQTMPDRVLKWVGAGTPDLGETNAAGELRGGGRQIAAAAQNTALEDLSSKKKKRGSDDDDDDDGGGGRGGRGRGRRGRGGGNGGDDPEPVNSGDQGIGA